MEPLHHARILIEAHSGSSRVALIFMPFQLFNMKDLDEKNYSDSQIGSIIYQAGPAGSFDRSARITVTVYRIPDTEYRTVVVVERREAEC